MRTTLFTLAALFLFSPAARCDDAADAKAIVEKAVKAAGFKPDDKLKAVTWKDKGKFTGGDFSMEYTGDFAFQGPDKYRFDVTGEFGGMKITFTAITNGDKAWQSAMGMTEEVKDEKLEYMQSQIYNLNVASLLPLLTDKEFKFATAGEKDVNGKKAVGVLVSRDKRGPVTLYFDKDSGLLVKTETKVKDEFQGWKEVPEETYLGEYKETGGKKFYSTMKI